MCAIVVLKNETGPVNDKDGLCAIKCKYYTKNSLHSPLPTHFVLKVQTHKEHISGRAERMVAIKMGNNVPILKNSQVITKGQSES